VEKKWYIVDAADKRLGRLASTIAIHIRGKDVPAVTPSIDMGAYVVVVRDFPWPDRSLFPLECCSVSKCIVMVANLLLCIWEARKLPWDVVGSDQCGEGGSDWEEEGAEDLQEAFGQAWRYDGGDVR
jgi:hypothetical protein